MEWLNSNQIKVNPVKRPKKITGTRFASIMGLNTWNTPFKTWCEITRTYEEPFVDTKYTRAGKIIEPKQAEYVKKAYFMIDLTSPTDVYGENYFKKTYGDFFPENPIFGGMWDYILKDDGKITGVLEMKTTKRAEDWKDGIPEYYALQAALYAFLLGVEDVIMVVSFLEDSDYEHPENFVPSAKNTRVIPFTLSEKYPNFARYVKQGINFWNDYVVTGISPEYDEKADAEILKELRTNNFSPDTDINLVISDAEKLKKQIEKMSAEIKPLQERLDTLTGIIKSAAIEQFRGGDKKVNIQGKDYVWTVSRGVSVKVNKNALEKDGLLDKYSTTEPTYKLTATIKEE